MRIAENPFIVLGVTPEDSVENLKKAAKAKGLKNRAHAAQYNKMLSILIDPRKRLDAEVRWFYSSPKLMKNVLGIPLDKMHYLKDFLEEQKLLCTENIFYCAEELYRFDKRKFEGKDGEELGNLMIIIHQLILQMDSDYSELSSDSLDGLVKTINDNRKTAGIPILNDSKLVQRVFQAAVKEDVTLSLKHLVENMDEYYFAVVTRSIARHISKSFSKSSINNHKIIDCFFQLYKSNFNHILNYFENKALDEIKRAKNYTQLKQLDSLFEAIDKFEFYAEPLQLYLRYIGKSNKESHSYVIAIAMKKLLSVLYKNQLTDLCFAIIKFEKKMFYAVPELMEGIQDDLNTLQMDKKVKHFFDIVSGVREELSLPLSRKNELGESFIDVYRMYILGKSQTWLNSLSSAGDMISSFEPKVASTLNKTIAEEYITLMAMCGSVGLWDIGLDVGEKGLPFISATSNKEMLNQYDNIVKAINSHLLGPEVTCYLSTGSQQNSKTKVIVLITIIVVALLIFFLHF